MKKKNYILMDKLFWLLICSLMINVNATAKQYIYLEQKAKVCGRSIIYFNNNVLILNMPEIKIWVIAYADNDEITVINAKDKLFFKAKYTKYQGNFAQRANNSFWKNTNTTNWFKLASCSCDNFPCLKLVKISKEQNFTQVSTSVLLNDKINFKSVECYVIENKNLSISQSAVISNAYGLKNLKQLPIEANLNYPDHSTSSLLLTFKTKLIDSDIEQRINSDTYRQVKGEMGVYDLKTNLTGTLKDFLDLK